MSILLPPKIPEIHEMDLLHLIESPGSRMSGTILQKLAILVGLSLKKDNAPTVKNTTDGKRGRFRKGNVKVIGSRSKQNQKTL